MVETIDITPEGMKTVEGRARVNAALREQDNAILNCANLLREVLSDVDNGHTDGEVFDDAKLALKVWSRASDNFLKAVAGR